ncbi:Wzz/FepE/Etk N-terminal domain-containing protein [Nocardioides sp. URHA0020]|uniref:Wzz/FepE/Etk N-terminal domain-containing protein n=1 Tax=Nocardioides sp. URHA0020 TaxID=1380392 RepID=UPI000B19F5CB|nr:Wzz/FepE/Etk N-terminal domain-containing protein [Nocardioides sp. URHA0020]
MEAEHVVRAVSRHKTLVAAIILVTMGAAGVGLWLAPKTYDASATISVGAAPGATQPLEDLDALRSSMGEVAGSQDVLDDVSQRLERSRSVDQLRDEIDGGWVQGTVLVQISVSDADPDVAADIANTVAEVLPLYDLSNGALVYTTSDPARPATSASSPNLLLGLGVAAVLAVILAICGALLRERRTAGFHGAEVEHLVGAPVLAALAPPKDPTTLPALYPGTSAADVFRKLRIGLEAEASSDPVSLVVVAGITDGEVSVWLGANVAVSLANVHRRVLLVDGRVGDQESSPIAAPDTLGLYDVLTGADLGDALSPGPVDNLTVLPSGEWGGASAETLLETRFAAAMREATDRFDIVVVLAPSLAACEDARIMAAGGSLVLAVPEHGVTASELRRHATRIRAVGVRLLGVVLVGRRVERMPARA